MTDYAQLVKRLRDHANTMDTTWYGDLLEAADAIENLQRQVVFETQHDEVLCDSINDQAAYIKQLQIALQGLIRQTDELINSTSNALLDLDAKLDEACEAFGEGEDEND